MIGGNPTWNQNVAAMTTKSRPLYTFEIPDEPIIIASFIPSEAGVTLDISTLLTQPLWARAQTARQALEIVTLPAVQGFTQTADDGLPLALAPYASVTRYAYGASTDGAVAYLGWKGVTLSPGASPLRLATKLTLVVASNMGTGGYVPYGEIDYSVLGSTPYISTAPIGWYQALYDNTAGWTNVITTLQLWPGNSDVGTDFPDLNAIEIRIAEPGSTTGSEPAGITFAVAAQLVIEFL